METVRPASTAGLAATEAAEMGSAEMMPEREGRRWVRKLVPGGQRMARGALAPARPMASETIVVPALEVQLLSVRFSGVPFWIARSRDRYRTNAEPVAQSVRPRRPALIRFPERAGRIQPEARPASARKMAARETTLRETTPREMAPPRTARAREGLAAGAAVAPGVRASARERLECPNSQSEAPQLPGAACPS